MTPAQKGAQTARERRERRKQEFAERLRDSDRAIAVCRSIRDDENAADADRLEAVKILYSITNASSKA